ncbi:BRCA1-A complex subunit RAP80 isoform X3 [Amia ocellicauda]|uniref:BRCA1-A complex subunit RAP80 isoform X3 n=1 Tax=Amia ocellicauda TaxID=2972642 RepID=UPI003463F6F5
MPRKKRMRSEESDQGTCIPRKKRLAGNKGQTFVVSDNENQEQNEVPQSREGRLRSRDRNKEQEMTEEEMMDLALKISESEASKVLYQEEQEEEEAVKLAIAQSLSENSTHDKKNQLGLLNEQEGPKAGSEGKEPFSHERHPCDIQSDTESLSGKYGSERSPVLILEKLSQDVLGTCQESGFVVFSQNSPLTLTPNRGSVPSSSQNSPLMESPTFPRRSSEVQALTQRMTSQISDEADSSGVSDDDRLAGKMPGTDRKRRQSSPPVGGNNRAPRHSSEKKNADEPLAKDHIEQRCQTWGLKKNEELHSQMTLHWTEEEEEEDVKKENQESCKADHTPFPQKNASWNAASEKDCFPDSESLPRYPSSCFAPSSAPVSHADKVSRDLEGSCQPSSSGMCSQHPAPSESSQPRPSGSPPLPKSPVFSKRGLSGRGRNLESMSERGRLRRKFTFRKLDVGEVTTADEDDCFLQKQSCSSRPASKASHPSTPPTPHRETSQGQPGQAQPSQGKGVVLYYWGVPFCPKGQNPDDYTQVILSQLEVYEKSLKEAQRGLLRKAEWGDPVLPAPSDETAGRTTRLLRLRKSESQSQASQDPDREGGRGEEEEEEEEEEEKEKEKEAEALGHWEDRRGVQQDRQDSDGEKGTLQREEQEKESPLLFTREEPKRKRLSLRRRLRMDSPETQMSDDATQLLNLNSPARTEAPPDVVVVEDDAVAGDEEGPDSGPSAPRQQVRDSVQCPLCMKSFPRLQVEVHAAYCDGNLGEEDVLEEANMQASALRRSSRRAEISENQPSSFASAKLTQQEKCFICKGFFSIKDYKRHIEICINQDSNRPSEGKYLFLTALEQLENKTLGNAEAESSQSSLRHRVHSGPISLLDAESDATGDQEPGPSIVSDSPIRGFIPISQTKDCLVDFKQQFTSRTGQRAGKKRKIRR